MKKIILLISLFTLIILTGCSKQDANNNGVSNRYYCEVNTDCVYSDGSGINTECVNIQFGDPDIMIYDFPGCVCDDNHCELEKCENPPCELG